MLSAADPSVNGVNATDEEGWAPIHSAASIGNLEIIQILLERGLSVLYYIASEVFVEMLLLDYNLLNNYDCICIYNRG